MEDFKLLRTILPELFSIGVECEGVYVRDGVEVWIKVERTFDSTVNLKLISKLPLFFMRRLKIFTL